MKQITSQLKLFNKATDSNYTQFTSYLMKACELTKCYSTINTTGTDYKPIVEIIADEAEDFFLVKD